MGRYGKRLLASAIPPKLLDSGRLPAVRLGPLVVKEKQVLAACLALCLRHPKVGWAKRMNVGAARHEGPDGKERFIRFAWKGAADITGQMTDGRRLEIECKRPGEIERPEQAEFLALVAAYGGVACCVDSATALKRVLDSA